MGWVGLGWQAKGANERWNGSCEAALHLYQDAANLFPHSCWTALYQTPRTSTWDVTSRSRLGVSVGAGVTMCTTTTQHTLATHAHTHIDLDVLSGEPFVHERLDQTTRRFKFENLQFRVILSYDSIENKWDFPQFALTKLPGERANSVQNVTSRMRDIIV